MTTVNFDSTPYWKALDQLLDDAHLGINPYGGAANTLVVTARPDGELPRSGQAMYSGIFRFQALRVEAMRDLRSPANDTLRLTMNIAWEPRVIPILIRQQRSSLEAVDDRGKRIEANSERPVYSKAPADFTMSEVDMIFEFGLPSRDVTKISSLKGSLTALIPGSKQTFEFDNIANARDVEKRTAGVAVTFEQIRRNSDVYEVWMRARYENAAEALQSNRGWIYANEAYLVDADGVRVNPSNYSGGPGQNEVRLSYVFALPSGPEGYSFVYRTPAAMLYVPVEYELTDIMLP
jgi:hypothetical protein